MSGDLSGFSLMELFRTEAESQTALLSEGLLSLEGVGATAEVIEPLMRAAHSLKGAARIVGMIPAEMLAHAMEDVFVAAQKGRLTLEPHHIDHLLQCVDTLSEISRLTEPEVETWTTANQPRLDAMIERLHCIEAGQDQAPAPTAPAPQPEPPAATEPVPAEHAPEPAVPTPVEAATPAL